MPHLKPLLIDSDLMAQQIRIISFHKDVIRTCKLVMPGIESYWLIDFQKDNKKGLWYPTVDAIVETAERIGADGFDVKAKMDLLDSSFAKRCREAGLRMHAWTIDDPSNARKLQLLGFDSITTNRPGYMRQILSPVESQSDKTPSAATELRKPVLSHGEVDSPSTRIEVRTEK